MSYRVVVGVDGSPPSAAALRWSLGEAQAHTVSEIAPVPAVPLQTLVAGGDPTEPLIAASEGADLLVLGSRGRVTIRRPHTRVGEPGLRGPRRMPGGRDQANRRGHLTTQRAG